MSLFIYLSICLYLYMFHVLWVARRAGSTFEMSVLAHGLPGWILASLPSTTKTVFFCRSPINSIWGSIRRTYKNDGYGSQWYGDVAPVAVRLTVIAARFLLGSEVSKLESHM